MVLTQINLQEVLTIVVMLNCPNIWLVPRNSGERLAEVKRMMAHKGGDHFTLLNIFQQFMKCEYIKRWKTFKSLVKRTSR